MSQFQFQILGGLIPDHQMMTLLHKLTNGCVNGVATHFQQLADHNSAHGDDRDLCCTSTHIHNHHTLFALDIYILPKSCRQWFFYNKNIMRIISGVRNKIEIGPFLHLRHI